MNHRKSQSARMARRMHARRLRIYNAWRGRQLRRIVMMTTTSGHCINQLNAIRAQSVPSDKISEKRLAYASASVASAEAIIKAHNSVKEPDNIDALALSIARSRMAA